jgi:hypothetical protein
MLLASTTSRFADDSGGATVSLLLMKITLAVEG